MIWQAIFAVALAAPVWSHPHNHRHKRPTTVTTWTTVTGVASTAATDAATEAATNVVSYTAAAADVEVVQTSSTAQATSYAVVAASETAQAATTYAVEAVQSTASAETTSTAAVATSTASTPGRAVWLWQSNLLQDDTEVAEFLSWSTSNDITTVYTLIDRDMGDAVFQSFIEQCTTVGISVEALMGDADWILGAGDPTLESQLTWLENYQGNSSTSALFSGIHVDVEPWGLDGWTTNEATYTAALQSIITQITALGTSLGLPVTADLPYWAETITCPTTGKTLDIWMLENLDAATFMTYRNTATDLLDIATSVLEAGETTGKPVWLAVETVDAADAILISYFGKTFTTLSEDLVSIKSTASTYGSFAGIAIHDYDGAKALSS